MYWETIFSISAWWQLGEKFTTFLTESITRLRLVLTFVDSIPRSWWTQATTNPSRRRWRANRCNCQTHSSCSIPQSVLWNPGTRGWRTIDVSVQQFFFIFHILQLTVSLIINEQPTHLPTLTHFMGVSLNCPPQLDHLSERCMRFFPHFHQHN